MCCIYRVPYQNDVCVLKLQSNLTWTDSVKPIELANASSVLSGNKKSVRAHYGHLWKVNKINYHEITVFSESATTAGWGVVKFESGQESSVLLKVTLPMVPNDVCSILYHNQVEIVDKMMLCAGTTGKDSCEFL